MIPSTQLETVFALGGYASGLVITGSYLVLALATRRHSGGSGWHVAVGLGSFIWCIAALFHEVCAAGAALHTPGNVGLAFALKVLATGLWITAGLAIWENVQGSNAPVKVTRALQVGALISSSAVAYSGFSAYFHDSFQPLLWGRWAVHAYILFYSLALITYGIHLLGRGTNLTRPVRFSTFLMLAGFAGLALGVVGAMIFPDHATFRTPIQILTKQSPLIVILGSLFLFARFRYADLFIRFSLHVALANAIGTIAIASLFLTAAGSDALNTIGTLPMFGAAMVVALGAGFYYFWADGLRRFIDSWLFRTPDFKESLEQLRNQLRVLHVEGELIQTTSATLTRLLESERTEVQRVEEVPENVRTRLALVNEFEITKPRYNGCARTAHCVGWIMPVVQDGNMTHALGVHISQHRRMLVSQEIQFIRSCATLLGQRLADLQRERERLERQSRESRLLQQVTEAELRALRAQLNPHFLFNALNTVADLIVTDPARAETMTLRLAQVFRHLLAHSSRTLTSIEEELGFVQKYLYIEEARFGDRLRVEIAIDPLARQLRVPSLILQPLVENALKHGLGPKPGVVNIWIRVDASEGHLRLVVEDDGVGIPGVTAGTTWAPENIRPLSPRGAGVGLKNVTNRLQAIYDCRAKFILEGRAQGGSRVTLTLPMDAPLAA